MAYSSFRSNVVEALGFTPKKKYPRAKSPWPIHQSYPDYSYDGRFIRRAINHHPASSSGFQPVYQKFLSFRPLSLTLDSPYSNNRLTSVTHSDSYSMTHNAPVVFHESSYLIHDDHDYTNKANCFWGMFLTYWPIRFDVLILAHRQPTPAHYWDQFNKEKQKC